MQAEKVTALYCRFSHDENFGGDSDSIAHQKDLLENYAQTNGFTNYIFYIDDGYTGVNFERPGIKQLIEDVQDEKIGTVIVKDSSRLGRNYLMVGQFTEILFPKYKVRYISIGDNHDTEEGLNDFLVFINLFNEWNSRDISNKMRAMLKQKGNSGKRLTTKAIYGFRLDPKDKEKWLIDDEAAKTVKKIYELFLSGMGVVAISDVLRLEKIERPSYHLGQRGQYGYALENRYNWSERMVKLILSKPEYCGDTVNFRTHRVSYKDKRVEKNDPSEYVVYKDTHPAIISREDFEKVQEILGKQKRRPVYMMGASLLGEYLVCYDCKGKMRVRSRGKRRNVFYECGNYSKRAYARTCTTHAVKELFITNYLLDEINRILKTAHEDFPKFQKMIEEKLKAEDDGTLHKQQTELKECRAKIEQIDKYIRSLYEDKVNGIVDADTFKTLSRDYIDEKKILESTIRELSNAEGSIKANKSKVERFYKTVKEYEKVDEITKQILSDFIDRIEVHKCDQPGKAHDRTWQLDVYFIGVGMLRNC